MLRACVDQSFFHLSKLLVVTGSIIIPKRQELVFYSDKNWTERAPS